MKKTPKTIKKNESVVRSLFVAVLLAIAVRSFAVQAFQVPTGSMKNTVLVGDHLFVNELAYGFRTPKYLPFTDIPIPHIGFNYADVKRGDVVVFEYPGDRDLVVPVKHNVDYIKRAVALAGDMVEIRDKQVYVNGAAVTLPPNGRYDEQPLRKGLSDPRIFPKYSGWNQDQYGPIRVPKKGDVLQLDAKNIDGWRVFIEREGHHVNCAMDGSVSIDGVTVTSYTVGRDYLWMLGDDRDNSEDSRFWGFCPAENVVGKAMFVYWSWYNPPSDHGDGYDPEETQSFQIRWDRILHNIN